MCCFFAVLVFLGPRAGILIWYLVNPRLWAFAFPTTWITPLLGSIFLPWVTLMYVIVSPGRTPVGWDWLWLGLALVADIAWWAGGGFRRRMPGYRSQY